MQLEEIIAERNEKNRKEKWSLLTDPNLYCLAIFFVLVMMMMLTGCDSEKNNLGGRGTKATFQVKVIALPRPNKYEVHIKWSQVAGFPPRGWFIRRMDKETGEERAAYREERTNFFNDESVEPGKGYRYTLGSIEENGGVVRAEMDVTIPDVDVRSKIGVPDFSDYYRISIRENSNAAKEGGVLAIIECAQRVAEHQQHRCLSQLTDGYPGDQMSQSTSGEYEGAVGDSAKTSVGGV